MFDRLSDEGLAQTSFSSRASVRARPLSSTRAATSTLTACGTRSGLEDRVCDRDAHPRRLRLWRARACGLGRARHRRSRRSAALSVCGAKPARVCGSVTSRWSCSIRRGTRRNTSRSSWLSPMLLRASLPATRSSSAPSAAPIYSVRIRPAGLPTAVRLADRQLLKLADDVEVYPGHGAGSLCGAGIGSTASTSARSAG